MVIIMVLKYMIIWEKMQYYISEFIEEIINEELFYDSVFKYLK